MQREPMISSLVKKSWNWNFANFKDLALILPEAATGAGVLKNFKHSQENTCTRVSFYAATLLKRRLWHRGFPVNFARFLRMSFSKNTSGWLPLFYNSCWLHTLQFYIAGNFQTVERHQSGKKFIHISQGFYRFIFLLHRFLLVLLLLLLLFSLTNACLPCRLCKAYVVLWAANRFVDNAFEQF